MKYKVANSKIQGKGLFVSKPIKQGEKIGVAHINEQPTSVIGKYHNHTEEDPSAHSVMSGNKRILFATRDLMPGDEITTNYRMQPELEQPEDFKKGGLVKLPKQGLTKKGKRKSEKSYSRSLEATNRVFTENTLFSKPKSRKRKVFDPSAMYYQNGGTTPEDYDQFKTFSETLPPNLQDPNFEYGNPDQYDLYGMWETVGKPGSFADVQDSEYFPLDEDGTYHGFTVGSDGTFLKPMSHSTTWKEVMNSQLSTDPFFQQNNLIKNEQGRLQYVPKAEYGMPMGGGMSQNYQGRRKFIHQDGGVPLQEDYIEAELTPEEIDEYRRGGFIVEEVEEYQGGGQIYTYPSRPGSQYKKVGNTWQIKNEGTDWKFVPIKDPTGERTKNLNQYAVKKPAAPAQSSSGGLDDYYKSALYDQVGARAESTDTQNYVRTAQAVKNKQVQAGQDKYFQDADVRAAYRNELAKDKTISQSYKNKLLNDFTNYDRNKQTEVARMYLSQKMNPDKVKQAVPQSTWSRAQDYLFNPFDALKASIVYGDITKLPGHYDAARKAGVNMTPRSYQERFNFADQNIPGRNLVGNALNSTANFADAAEKTYYYSRQGKGLQAAENALRFVPLAGGTRAGQAVWNYAGDVGDAFSAAVLQKTPLAGYASKVSSPVLKTALQSASPGNVLSSYSLARGIQQIPQVISTGNDYYQRGDTESFKNFAINALDAGVSLSPLGGARFLSSVNPYRYGYSFGKSGYDYLKNKNTGVGTQAVDIFNIARNLPKNQFGGMPEFVETELTNAEIQDLIDSGYVVEELD